MGLDPREVARQAQLIYARPRQSDLGRVVEVCARLDGTKCPDWVDAELRCLPPDYVPSADLDAAWMSAVERVVGASKVNAKQKSWKQSAAMDLQTEADYMVASFDRAFFKDFTELDQVRDFIEARDSKFLFPETERNFFDHASNMIWENARRAAYHMFVGCTVSDSAILEWMRYYAGRVDSVSDEAGEELFQPVPVLQNADDRGRVEYMAGQLARRDFSDALSKARRRQVLSELVQHMGRQLGKDLHTLEDVEQLVREEGK